MAQTEPEARKGSDQKRSQILDGARRVFMTAGFEGASMNQIAEVAGVSKGTLYNYFTSKEELFTALILEKVQLVPTVFKPLDFAEGDAESVLIRFGIGFLSMVLDRPQQDMYRVILSESRKFPELGLAFEGGGPEFGKTFLRGYLLRLKAEGRIDFADEDLAAEQLVSLCDAGLTRKAHMTGAEFSPEQIERTVRAGVRLFLKGLSV